MPVNISGKQYVTVSERVEALHKDIESQKIKKVSIITEKLCDNPVLFRATLTIDGDVYTGTSAANPNKMIEKLSPYEVAETSAVGRALGFAGYGSVDSIASADEIVKAQQETPPTKAPEKTGDVLKDHGNGGACEICGELKDVWKEGVSKAGKPYAFWACKTWHKPGETPKPKTYSPTSDDDFDNLIAEMRNDVNQPTSEIDLDSLPF